MKMILHLVVINQRSILRRLAELQYERNNIDFRRGTYRVRGGVIDVFPADSVLVSILFVAKKSVEHVRLFIHIYKDATK